ncbi:protein kinase domain protein [Ichthyophthirius multifiliis]|uniref:Protein kinase domain protein n=1 Tax=Ichthyophthirius multifiliis TaxID=5932 RepID=G0R4W0_ICHMU|nr:protein kinase domain protein [Ichthyophthirius multifiliis]EGR27503.1 protein kinase domain protein [Ichthyophthirius multifiliis]|eukprot:XP_004024413.1 protein kinase domain protein [Ichthyophthirius multifiliis]
MFQQKKLDNSSFGKQALINEMEIMRKVNNPYIIKLYEVYESQNSIYFILESLIGGELMERLKKYTSIKEYDIQQIMKNLLIGIEHLHSIGIMHRDLKPQNLLLRCKTNNYGIVLADLGLATYQKNENQFLKRCGTPGYIAPEVLKYKDNDPIYGLKCDIFSAGIIFYLLLTGKVPFQAQNYKNVITLNKFCQINYDILELKNVSQLALDLLQKMLQPDPNWRISASECLQHSFFNKNIIILVHHFLTQTT